MQKSTFCQLRKWKDIIYITDTWKIKGSKNVLCLCSDFWVYFFHMLKSIPIILIQILVLPSQFIYFNTQNDCITIFPITGNYALLKQTISWWGFFFFFYLAILPSVAEKKNNLKMLLENKLRYLLIRFIKIIILEMSVLISHLYHLDHWYLKFFAKWVTLPLTLITIIMFFSISIY